MDSPETLSLQTVLPLPVRGGSTRVQVGRNELVLESVRGGHSLLWLEGREARRYVLGLGAEGQLTLTIRAPRLPCRVVVREVITVVPKARLHGYVQLPLVPTVSWHSHDGILPLIELLPRELEPEWDDGAGAVFRCTSTLHVRFPMRSGELRATVPVRLRNLGEGVLSPAFLPLALADADLRELRGSVVAPPQRLHWNGLRWQAPATRAVEVAL